MIVHDCAPLSVVAYLISVDQPMLDGFGAGNAGDIPGDH